MSDGLPTTWYQQGSEPEPAPLTDRGDRKRYWLRPDEEDVVTFIDDDPFRIWEHDAKVGGEWGTRFTCVNGLGEGFDPCPGCHFKPRNLRPKRYRVGFVTVVTEREFEYQGRTIKNLRRLFPIKGDLIKIFTKLKKDRGGSMVGARFRLWRTGPRAFTVGDNWTFVDWVPGIDAKTSKEEARKIMSTHYSYQDREGVPLLYEPYDYLKLLAPQPRKDILAAIGHTGETNTVTDGEEERETSTTSPGTPVGQHIEF